MKPKVIERTHFGNVVIDPELPECEDVMEVYVTLSDGTRVRLERGVQYEMVPPGYIHFRFQPEDIGELFKSDVVEINYDISTVSMREPNIRVKKKRVSYESPWKIRKRA